MSRRRDGTHPKGVGIDWDDKITQRLRDFWSAGIPAAEIGRRLGVSKNSIIGKVHRLGLDARPSPIQEASAQKPPRIKCPAHTLPPLASETRKHGGFQLTVLSDEATTAAKKMLADGCGVKTVAKKFRISWRRAAEMRNEVVAAGTVRKSRRASTAGKPITRKTEAKTMPLIRSAEQIEFRVVEPVPVAQKIVPLHKSACCWPIGEPGTKNFRFCDDTIAHWTEANPIRPPYSYCSEHRALAYVQTAQSRKVAA